MLLDKAVRLQLPDDVETIVTIDGAGHRLLKWPANSDTAKHVAARRAVLAALQSAHDHRKRVAARKALEAAAKEAGLLVRGDPR